MPEESAMDSIKGLENTATQELSRAAIAELLAPASAKTADIRPYAYPSEDTDFPVEYAFHLLGGIDGRTVVDLGCRSGVASVILARLGASVIAIDASEKNLEETAARARAHGLADRVKLMRLGGCSIPTPDASADRVLCQSILDHPQPRVMARQIRRILKPGGRAVFHELSRPQLLPAIRKVQRDSGVETSQTQVTKDAAVSVSRAVGLPGRFREFWLLTRLLCELGVAPTAGVARVLQRFDAALFRRMPFTKALASSFVWEARKES